MTGGNSPAALVDDCGKVKGWLDASSPGTGNWMKLVRSAEEQRQRNLMAVQLVDDCGKVKGWLDASSPGTGNWMKLVRSAEEQRQRNLMAVQVDEQVSWRREQGRGREEEGEKGREEEKERAEGGREKKGRMRDRVEREERRWREARGKIEKETRRERDRKNIHLQRKREKCEGRNCDNRYLSRKGLFFFGRGACSLFLRAQLLCPVG
ncbi:PR domain Zinc finger protein 16-like isoform x2 [Plakobranchus ocellatus]|uniref:PR domain Zinc finger protein 16-like isoform x2 n=1 Tax=Plakobranchus ocellatus TaxID=259542 RepID=A0AAV4AQE5_9GAST|nr:PR domain Zinc finger protein 16-like isoform x2 [Plakobranchus ocellatus]